MSRTSGSEFINASRIKAKLKEKGMTQIEISKLIEIDKDSFNTCLRKGKLTRSNLIKVSRILDCSPYYLTGESDNSDETFIEALNNDRELKVNVMATVKAAKNDMWLLQYLSTLKFKNEYTQELKSVDFMNVLDLNETKELGQCIYDCVQAFVSKHDLCNREQVEQIIKWKIEGEHGKENL